ncbi:MAG: alpha/beta hydrolase [Pseudomonadota bacterium]
MKKTATYYAEQYNARAAIPEHPAIFARWIQQSAWVRRSNAGMYDLMYGESAGERLDIFPTRQPHAPLIVFIHGGWWRSLDKSDFSMLAPAFTNAGFNLALTNYTLAPEVSIEEIVKQQLRALAWLYKNSEKYDIDHRRIIVIGHSAGAHLAAMMMAASWPTYDEELPLDLIKAGVLLSGVYDLEPILQADFVNIDLQLTPPRIEPLSPALMPRAQKIPFITSVGGKESDEFKYQTQTMAKAWTLNHQQHIDVPECNHLTICDALADTESALFKATIALAKSIK